MEYINRIELQGIIGQVHVQQVAQQTVVRFSLMTERIFENRNGELTVETTWHRCVAWSSESNPDVDNIAKGSRVYVAGRLRVQRFTDATGDEQTFYEVVASTVQLV